MWTALQGQEILDLRKIPSKDRVRLHSDPTTKLRCRGCEGRVHMRKSAEDSRGNSMAVFDDGLGPLITFAHNPVEAENTTVSC